MSLPLLSLQSRARAAALALVLAAATLAACAAPAPPETDSASPAGKPAAVAADASATESGGGSRTDEPATPAPGSKKKWMTGGPLPPERADDRTLPPEVKLDTSCKTDADCTVKNVGNCCGEFPACVNVASPTDPKGVQARCAQSGMSAVCGFAEIRGCSCVQGTCQAMDTSIVEETTR